MSAKYRTAARLLGVAVVGVLAGAILQPAGAHYDPDRQRFNHLKKHFVAKALARKPGTINAAKNPVDWTKLKGVPDAFADGPDGDGFTAQKAGPADLPGGPIASAGSVIGTLSLPAGSYAVFASLYLRDVTDAMSSLGSCRLEVGTATDDSGTLEVEDAEVEDIAVDLMVAQSLPAAGTAVVRCTDDEGVGNFTDFRQLRITAIELASLTESAIP